MVALEIIWIRCINVFGVLPMSFIPMFVTDDESTLGSIMTWRMLMWFFTSKVNIFPIVNIGITFFICPRP